MHKPTRFVVVSAAAAMPSSCWGRYRRVAVVEVDPARLPDGAATPRMISERARGVVRIVRTWERLNVGATDRCAFGRAMAEAETEADRLNSG